MIHSVLAAAVLGMLMFWFVVEIWYSTDIPHSGRYQAPRHRSFW